MTASRPATSVLMFHMKVAICPAILACAWWMLANSREIKAIDSLPVSLNLPNIIQRWEMVPVAYCQKAECAVAIEFAEDPPPVCSKCGIGSLDALPLFEKELLPADTIIIHGRYKDPSGKRIEVAVVIAGTSRASMHKPEWCLSGQGFRISNQLQLRLNEKNDAAMNLLELESESYRHKAFFAYWFVGPSEETPSRHRMLIKMTKERILEGKAYRWAYISILMPQLSSRSASIEDLKIFADGIRTAITVNKTSI